MALGSLPDPGQIIDEAVKPGQFDTRLWDLFLIQAKSFWRGSSHIVPLLFLLAHFCFCDASLGRHKIYFLLELCNAGEMFTIVQSSKRRRLEQKQVPSC
jgi:hypothetical protein